MVYIIDYPVSLKRINVVVEKAPDCLLLDIYFQFLPDIHIVPLINHLCTLCCQPTSMWYSHCQSAWYCSPEHIYSLSVALCTDIFFYELLNCNNLLGLVLTPA